MEKSDYQGEGGYMGMCHRSGYIFKRRLVLKKTVFLRGTLNMGLINKVDMVCLSPMGYGV